MNERQKPPRAPETKVAPISFSKETFAASKNVAEAPSEKSVQVLETLVEKDLQKSGITLQKPEKKKFSEKVKNFFLGKPLDASSEGAQSEQPINITEYMQTFSDLSKTYGLDKQKAKYGTLAALMIQGKAIGDLAGVSAYSIAMTLWNEKNNLPKTKEFVGRFVASKWVPNAMVQDASLGVIPMHPDSGLSAAVELMGQANKFKWPLGFMAAYIPSAIAEVAAEFRMVDAMKSVKQSINERASQSLVMRDMEFVQDKSAAEINNILEKGKQSTIDFIQTTYTDVLPRLSSIGFATAGQLPINPIGALLQAIRLPFLYGMSSMFAKEKLAARAADLKRKDFIDTRINATLGSLEMVKTSESMEQGIAELQQHMKERDESGTLVQKDELKQGVAMDLLSMGFSYGIPLVHSGIEWIRSGKNKELAAEAGLLTKIGGRIIERNSEELVDIYLDKIQPYMQDIKRMEELLGPYDQLDKPDGAREKARVGASTLQNFVISVKDLSYRDVLHHASLEIPEGSFVTIKGPSGSGKTSLLRNMVGLYTSSKDAVSYGGVGIDGITKYGEDSLYTKLAYASQNTQFFENMTLRDNLLLWTKKKVSNEQITGVLKDLRLDQIVGRLDSTVKHFSGGELRRIGLARALLKDPKILFLDEPTANLDDESAKQVVEIIKDMRAKRKDMTVVAVTHDANFEAIAERVVDLRDINHQNESEKLSDQQVFYAKAIGSAKIE